MTHVNIKEIRDEEMVRSNSSRNVHDHLKSLSVEELQALSATDRLPWHTLCLNVTGDLNVGTIIRTSHCLGAESVTIFGRQKIDNRSLVGAANYIRIEKIRAIDDDLVIDPEAFLNYMLANKFTPIFVECGGVDLPDFNWTTRVTEIARRGWAPCLVMGNEGSGIPDDILWAGRSLPNTAIVSIPQRGVIRSLNVGVAHAIVAGDLCISMNWM